jgi:hypothetical protein
VRLCALVCARLCALGLAWAREPDSGDRLFYDIFESEFSKASSLKASSQKRVLKSEFSKAISQKRFLESNFSKAISRQRVLESELSKASYQKRVIESELSKVGS